MGATHRNRRLQKGLPVGSSHPIGVLLKPLSSHPRVQQLGSIEAVTMTQDQPAVLLSLTLPDDVVVEARRLIPPGD